MQKEEFSEVLDWAASLGISDHSSGSLYPSSTLGYTLCVAEFPNAGGRGLAAIRNVERGEVVLRVPRAALISVESAKNDPCFGETVAEFTHLSSVQMLCVYLLSEVANGSASKWYHYLRHLPREHHTLSHFSPVEAQELQVDDAIWTASMTSKKTQAEWEGALGLLTKLQLEPKFRTFKAWLWASATISSRALHVPWDKAGVLCPVGDLFNYEAPTGFSTSERLTDGNYDPASQCYCFYARRSYKKGEQVFLCYGQLTNLDLLEHYGFVLPENPSEVVYITLPSSKEFGNNYGEETELPHHPGGYYLNSEGNPSFSLVEALRLRSILKHGQRWSQDEDQRRRRYAPALGHAISRESDLKVFRWLGNKCTRMLEELPTSITQDEEILRTGPENHLAKKLELAVQWRLGYKRILQRGAAHCRNEIARKQAWRW